MVCLRNALQPINRLHPELLAMCAAFVPHTDPKPIVSLTHVCRYWRDTITSGPRSWASIGTVWKRLVPLCLERAGLTPLTVNLSAIKMDQDFLQALLPHVSRISNLSLTGYSSIKVAETHLPGFFDSPMPNLTTPKLVQNEDPPNFFPPNKPRMSLLLQNVSRLESLHLTRTPLYRALFNIASLVELKFVGYKFPPRKFINFLVSNRALEVVVLYLEFTRLLVLPAPEERVSLPRLRRLALTCHGAIDARGLLSCLAFTRGVKIEVCWSEANLCGDLASFLPHPPAPIQDLLVPTTTITSRHYPSQVDLFSGDGSFSFRSREARPKMCQEFHLFVTNAVRQFHICHWDGMTAENLAWA